MTLEPIRRPEEAVVEIEFELSGEDFFLASASGETASELELETMTPRSDGTVLEFLTVRGADPGSIEEALLASPGVSDAELLMVSEEELLVQCISESRIASALADEETGFKRITAREGEGRLVAEIPPHIDVSQVIDSFLAEYPNAELVARRETDKLAPTLTEHQFLTELVSDMTDKQLQALRVAYANGYFEWPRDHSAEEVAERLDVATPTFSEHLRNAERKLLDRIFE